MSDEHKVRNEDLRAELAKLERDHGSCQRALEALNDRAKEFGDELARSRHDLLRSAYRLQGAMTVLQVLLNGGRRDEAPEPTSNVIELASH